MTIFDLLGFGFAVQLADVARGSVALALLVTSPAGAQMPMSAPDPRAPKPTVEKGTIRVTERRAVRALPDKIELNELFGQEWSEYYNHAANDTFGYKDDFASSYSKNTHFSQIKNYRCGRRSSYIHCKISVEYFREAQIDSATVIIDFTRNTGESNRLTRYWGKIAVH